MGHSSNSSRSSRVTLAAVGGEQARGPTGAPSRAIPPFRLFTFGGVPKLENTQGHKLYRHPEHSARSQIDRTEGAWEYSFTYTPKGRSRGFVLGARSPAPRCLVPPSIRSSAGAAASLVRAAATSTEQHAQEELQHAVFLSAQ